MKSPKFILVFVKFDTFSVTEKRQADIQVTIYLDTNDIEAVIDLYNHKHF